ncbi:MAG: acyl-CoA thioesterase [Microscillaceae bacterium]|nr:acyl-CoA thioesterase [Microscillaceae bacterium]
MLTNYRPVSYSQITLTELMVPAYANFGGKIHGGILLSLMDKVAYACAHKHAGNYCVTVSVNRVEFLEPVEVGEMVSMLASVNYVGRTSMVVGIKVIAENFKTNTVKHTNSSYFTMVAKDEEGQPTPVPGLILENAIQARRFLKTLKLKELRDRLKNDLEAAEANLDLEAHREWFVRERCQLRLA